MLHAPLPSTAKMQFPLRRRHTDDEPLPLPSSSSSSDQASFAYPPNSLFPSCAAGRSSSFSSSSVASSQVTSSRQTLKRSAPVACEGRRRSAAGWRSSPRSSVSSLGSEGVGGLTEKQVVSLSFLKNRSFAGPPGASAGFDDAEGALEEEASNAQSPKRRRSRNSESDGIRAKRRKETRSHESSPQALSSSFSNPSVPGKERTDAVLTLHAAAVASSVSRSALPSSFRALKEAGEKTSRQCLPVSVAPEEASPSALEGPRSPVATSPRSSSRWPASPLSRRLSFSPRYSNFPALSPLLARRGRPGAAESLREEAAEISGFFSLSGSLDSSLPTTETVSKSAKEETKPLPPTCAVSSPRSPPFSSSSSASSSSPSSSFPSSEACSSSSGRVDRCGTCGCRILFPSLEVALERQRRTPRKARRCMEREAVTGGRGAEEAEESPGSDEEDGARNGLEAKGFGRQNREKSRERDTCSAEPDPRLHCNACRSRVYIQSFFDDLRLLATGFHSDLRSLTRAVAFSPQKIKTFLLKETERSSAPSRLGGEQRTSQSLSVTSVSSSPSCRCPICTSFLSLYSEDRRAVFCRKQRPTHERKGTSGGGGDKEETGEKEGGKAEGMVEKPDSILVGDAASTPVRPKSLQCLLRAAGRQCWHLQEQVERLSSEDQAFSEREQAELMRPEDGEREKSTHVTLQSFRGILEALHVANETKLEHLLQVLAEKGGNAALALSDRLEDLRTSLPGFHSSAVLLLAPASRGVAPSVGFSQVSEVRESSTTKKKFLDASNSSLPSLVSASAGEAGSSRLSPVPSASAGISCLEKERVSPGAPCASSGPRLWRTAAHAEAESSVEDSSSSRECLPPRDNSAANKQPAEGDGGARKRDSASHSPRALLKRLGLSEATLRMLDPLSKQGRGQK